MPSKRSLILFLLLTTTIVHPAPRMVAQARSRAPPEVTSTLLHRHRRYYTRQPPHDPTLYQVLQVSPNATAAEITKAYRILSRRLHPDKQTQHQKQNVDEEDAVERRHQWDRVREAYEILQDDSTRLLYHRYGLWDARDAVRILTGQQQQFRDDPDLDELLRLMGYNYNDDDNSHARNQNPNSRSSSNTPHSHNSMSRQDHECWRVWFVAANLVEVLRPVVEGALPEDYLLNHVMQQCDRLKRLPLGAQILRCIGRAYRYSGQRVLRRLERERRRSKTRRKPWPLSVTGVVQESWRDQWREAKHLATAAVAGGRVIWEEKRVRQSRASSDTNSNGAPASVSPDYRLEYSPPEDAFGSTGPIDDEFWSSEEPPTDTEMKESEQRKAQRVLLESLQVEALWKICKIDLDRTIREACNLILEEEYFFFPSQWAQLHPPPSRQRRHHHHPRVRSDGWIGSSGLAVTAEVGRTRAASLLISMGDIMVQRSKEGTAWME